ncbi:MAG TPA: plastocyanin/azurin family copper-binding protein [Solirubrobacteraceae bacterium]|jgi:plastocyanin|nr:plastocyanin/azurin family copper-binding protein [Solirubrobacteraceae bacterium]
MKRGILALAALMCGAALAFAAGCGSSGSSNEAETTTVTVGGRTSTITTSKTTSGSKSKAGGLQPNTTPKYGTPPANAPVQSGAVQIAYRNIAIDPDVLKVKVGSTIKWTNYDPVEHNVTSKGGPAKFASKNFGEGGTFEFKATKAGVIHYVCTIHPTTMNGTIEVVN